MADDHIETMVEKVAPPSKVLPQPPRNLPEGWNAAHSRELVNSEYAGLSSPAIAYEITIFYINTSTKESQRERPNLPAASSAEETHTSHVVRNLSNLHRRQYLHNLSLQISQGQLHQD